MRGWLRLGLIAAGLAAAAGGCAHRAVHHAQSYQAHSQTSATLEQTLSPTTPQAIEIDDRQIDSLDQVENVTTRGQRPPGEYHALSRHTCQCLASRASAHGNTLAAERRALAATASPHGLSDEERLKLRVLRATELEARNSSASVALKVYYHLAEAEANRLIVARSLKDIDDALAGVLRMRQHGLQIPFDDSELERQRLDIRDKQIELESQIDQLNAQLTQLMGLATDEPRPRIWPTTDWTVVVAPVDLDAAVREGLELRPELGLLASLRRSLRTETVGVARGVLGGASGLLGTQTKFTGLISLLGMREFIGQRRSNRLELPERRRQLDNYTRQRRNEITSEIQQAALESQARLRQVAVAKAEVQSWRRHLDALAQKARIDEATFIDLTRARLKRLQAESDEIGQITGWRIALVKLHEAQGRLVAECDGDDCKQGMLTVDASSPPLELPAEPLPTVMPLPDPTASIEPRSAIAASPSELAGAAAPEAVAAPPDSSHEVPFYGVPLRVEQLSAGAAYVPELPSSRRQKGEPPPPEQAPVLQAIATPVSLPDVAAEAESADAAAVDPEA